MNEPATGDLLLLFCTGLIVLFRVYSLVRRLWNYPLDHGPGFFLGVEVQPRFYEGEGARWLKRYRTVLVAEHLLEAAALVVILASGRWSLLPLWAGGGAVLATSTFLGLFAYTRLTLGAFRPVQSTIAVSLVTRRLGDYISWPEEALIAALIAFSWLLLLTQGDAQVRWQVPVTTTYVVIGLLSFKILVVRNNFPLPPERTEEHHRWMETSRRYSLRVMDIFNWFFVTVLVGYALQHGWPPAQKIVWLRWIFVGIALGIWLVMIGVLIRGSGRLAAMGRDLRPLWSWSGPFRPGASIMPGGRTWTVTFLAWFTGLVLLLVFFRR